MLLGLAVALGPGVARADPPQAKVASSAEHDRAVKQAAALNDEAWSLYEQGRYRAAVEKLDEAVRIDPGGKDLVYNLALIHEKLADFDDATAYYKRYLEMETEPKAKARVQASLRRVEGAKRERAERGLTPGSLAPESTPAPSPPPPPRPVRPWVVATGAVAATAFLLGGIFAIAAVSRSPGSSPRTGGGISVQDLMDDARVAHADAMVADISFLIAAAATGTATFLYFSTPRSAPAAATAARLSVGPGGLKVSF